ncbi:MAG: alpha/beta fold hydrolase [Betaproteobacteria bacterium]
MAYASVNGLNMHYDMHGDGPPLLLLHGGGGPVSDKWVSFFAPHFRVIAPQQMGYGRTADAVDRPFHYHEMAEDTLELMRQIGVESARVVGYSDGGIIALDMAIHHPEHVTRLAVTGANARTDGYTAVHWEGVAATAADWPAPESYCRLSPDGAEHWPVLLRRLQRMWAVEPCFTYEQLQVIKAPTLLIFGDRDLVTLEHAVEMFKSVPGAQLCVVPRAGHGIMPKEAVLTFLNEQ